MKFMLCLYETNISNRKIFRLHKKAKNWGEIFLNNKIVFFMHYAWKYTNSFLKWQIQMNWIEKFFFGKIEQFMVISLKGFSWEIDIFQKWFLTAKYLLKFNDCVSNPFEQGFLGIFWIRWFENEQIYFYWCSVLQTKK